MDELIAENHAHVGCHCLPCDLLAQVFRHSQRLSKRIRSRMHGSDALWHLGNAGHELSGALLGCQFRPGCRGRNVSPEDVGQLLAGLSGKHQGLIRDEEWCWEPNRLQTVVKIGTETSKMICFHAEIRLHLDMLAELFRRLPHPQQSQRLHLVRQLAESEQPGEVCLEQRSDPRPQALDGNIGSIVQDSKKHLSNAPRGMRFLLEGLEGDLLGTECLCDLVGAKTL
mmetsp:Transcript_60468/g.128171  ORF Transcript_60468/g.128171 Transcript_60468/m.128171 type:complete len:226 (+) Transcript_60468:1054-1731(+)